MPIKKAFIAITYIQEMGEKMRILRNLCIMSLFAFLAFGTSGAFAQSNNPFGQLGEEQGGAMPDPGQMQGPGGGGQGHGPGGQGHGPGGGEGNGPDGGQGDGAEGGQGNAITDLMGQGNGPQGPREPAGPSGYCTDGLHLYVIANGKISQYNLADLTLLAAVELPTPEIEEPDPAEELDPSEVFDPSEAFDPSEENAPPRRGGGPSGSFIEGDFLYILHNGGILQYSLPDLVLQNTAEPEPAE